MESALVETFTEITNESQANAVRRLASCQWNLEKALNLFYAGGTLGAAPSTPVEAEDEVRAPIPSRVERLYGDATYHGRTAPAIPSIWDAPSPKPGQLPVPAVPIQGPSWSEIQASGWGEAEPHDGGGNYEEVQVDDTVERLGWEQAADPGNNGSDAGEDSRFVGSQEVDDVVQEEDNVSLEDYGAVGSYEEQQVDGGGTTVINYNKEDGDEQYNGEYEEEQHNADEYGGEDQEYNVSDNESDIDDYGYEMDEDDGYHDSMMEEDEEPSSRSRGQQQQQAPQSLAQMYRLPYELMFHGSSFHYAKVEAARQDKFLLVNIQQARGDAEFASCLQNRDLWANALVAQVVKDNFVLFLPQKQSRHDDEGVKVFNYYKVQDEQLPAVLVLDPITGEKLAMSDRPILQPDDFMMFVDNYMTTSKPSERSGPPKLVVQETEAMPDAVGAGAAEHETAPPDGSASAAAAGGGDQEQEAPPESSTASAGADGGEKEQEPVPMVEEAPAEMVESDDEPVEGEKMYKLRVRFPDGNVVTKEFGCKRKVSKLFAFCRSAVHDAGRTEQTAFRVMRFAGRAFEELQNTGATFEDLGLNCATVSVVFVT